MSQSNQHTSEELFARVTGFVQGVGFRQFVVHKALNLGLRGFVRNASDGSVEVVAQGARPALEGLLVLLRQGPSASEVEEVSTSWREPTELFPGFYIRW
ncbi:MAG TPA: acylphosphatase [Ktedonobacteraceae bacterium]|nr:acylphosphatase [Ktedonobacteraceae bacterium]